MEIAINPRTAERRVDRSSARGRRRASELPPVCLVWKQSCEDCAGEGESTDDLAKSSGFRSLVLLMFLQAPKLKSVCPLTPWR